MFAPVYYRHHPRKKKGKGGKFYRNDQNTSKIDNTVKREIYKLN